MSQTLYEIFQSLDPEVDGASIKVQNYFEVYETFLSSRRDMPLKLLEIGIEKGGSLAMWKKYLPNASIVGIDILQGCKQREREGIKVYIGDQSDPLLLSNVISNEAPFDIIIDDGGHHTNELIGSFMRLFPYLRTDGLYIVEDLHTCFMPEFDSHLPTFMTFAASLCPLTTSPRATDPVLDRTIKNMHFYSNMVVIEKGFTPSVNIKSPGFDSVPYPV